MPVLSSNGISFEIEMPVVIIGGGACGMAAALAVQDAGVDPLILERDSIALGNTALSSGMIPACGTRIQHTHGVEDSVAIMAADIQKKARGEVDIALLEAICQASGPMIDWLADVHNIELTLVEGFLYPGHSCLRMHAPVSRTGTDLIGALGRAVEHAGITVMTDAQVVDVYADQNGRIAGVGILRPDGSTERLGCTVLILACNGFGGNSAMVEQYIPQMAGANYFGHEGNQGDAVIWGQALGAATSHLGAYQGHGSVAHPHGILMSWALMMQGGIQLNTQGVRFSNEHEGYSEQAQRVLSQPDGIAWNVFDNRLHALGMDFDDYRQADALGAIHVAEDIETLSDITGMPFEQLAATIAQAENLAAGQGNDTFGRDFTTNPALQAPYRAVKVSGSLFHTQGGLVVDSNARVLRENGEALPNLLAGGGAACGISGSQDWGYLSGNGLLTALTLGRIAGTQAADISSANQ